VHSPDYHRHPVPHEIYVPDHYGNVAAEHAAHVEAQGGEAKASATK
jgi:hypothetical protein